MTVKELIEQLMSLPDQDAVVCTYVGDAEEMVPVTGMLYGGDTPKIVALQTDNPND